MDLRSRIKQSQEADNKFILTAGLRFGGKTSGLGTLPGKTLLAIAKDLESGAKGAVNVAKECGNHVDYIFFEDGTDILELAKAAFDGGYDNFAVDGLTALSEIEADKPSVKKLITSAGNSVFKGWRMIGESLVNTIRGLKRVSAEYNKPVVVTLALKDPKADATGAYAALEPEVKGNMALGEIRGKCPYFVCARRAEDGDGKPVYVLQTTPDDMFPARLDGVLAKNLPKGFRTEADKVEDGQKIGYAALLDFLNS